MTMTPLASTTTPTTPEPSEATPPPENALQQHWRPTNATPDMSARERQALQRPNIEAALLVGFTYAQVRELFRRHEPDVTAPSNDWIRDIRVELARAGKVRPGPSLGSPRAPRKRKPDSELSRSSLASRRSKDRARAKAAKAAKRKATPAPAYMSNAQAARNRTKAEKRQLVADIKRLTIEGYGYSDIIQHIRSEGRIPPSTNAIKKVRDQMFSSAKQASTETRKRKRKRLRQQNMPWQEGDEHDEHDEPSPSEPATTALALPPTSQSKHTGAQHPTIHPSAVVTVQQDTSVRGLLRALQHAMTEEGVEYVEVYADGRFKFTQGGSL